MSEPEEDSLVPRQNSAPMIQDERCDLFVLDVNQNVQYQSSQTSPQGSSSSRSNDRSKLRKSKAVVIPYVPKPVSKCHQSAVEYVPGGIKPLGPLDDAEIPSPLLQERPPIATREIANQKDTEVQPDSSAKPLVAKNVTHIIPSSTNLNAGRLRTCSFSSDSSDSSAAASSHAPPFETNFSFPNKKIRIAHTPSYDAVTARQTLAKRPANKKANLWQTVMDRYQQSSALPTSTVTCDAPATHQLSTMDKFSKRVAHVPSKSPVTSSNLSRFVMPMDVNAKIPLSKRCDFLSKLVAELTAHVDKSNFEEIDKLVNQAKEIEHEMCLRSKNIKNIYLSLGASKIQTIRSEQKMQQNLKCGVSSQPVTSFTNVSHNEILNAKAINCSVLKREKVLFQNLPHERLLQVLDKLTIPKTMLQAYSFPVPDPSNQTMATFPNKAIALHEYKPGVRITCTRCRRQYSNPQVKISDPCVYHGGRIYKFRDKQGVEGHYSCCQGDSETGGCNSAPFHVTDGHEFLDTRLGFISTAPCTNTETWSVFALDCEMCYTEMALELSRVTLLDFEGNVIYDTLVKPSTAILDYNTEFSGIAQGDLDDVTTTLADVQKQLLECITGNSILIGHGLDSDFRVLKLFHERVIDTTYLFPHRRGLPFKRSLATLASMRLNKIIQNGLKGGHDSHEDAKAALDLVKIKLQEELNKEQQMANRNK